jgi:hypothetical protein
MGLDSDHKVTVDVKKTGESSNVQLVCVLSGRTRYGHELAKNSDEAISAACALLDRKINVQEIGLLLGMGDPGEIIDSLEIRKLHAMRIQTG